MQVCSRCGKELESERYKLCDACREYSRAWRNANPNHAHEYHIANLEKIHKQKCEYRKATSEHIAEKNHEWYLANKEESYARSRAWKKAHPEKVREHCKQYYLRHGYKQHPERWCNYVRNRRTSGKHTLDELRELFDKQDGRCFYCGKLLYASFDRDVHVDHKTPISRGGTNDIFNIALACETCNRSKYNKTAEEFMVVMRTR